MLATREANVLATGLDVLARSVANTVFQAKPGEALLNLSAAIDALTEIRATAASLVQIVNEPALEAAKPSKKKKVAEVPPA